MVKIAGGISTGVPPSWVNAVCDSSWQDPFGKEHLGLWPFPFDRGHSLFFLRQYMQLRLGRHHSGKHFKSPEREEQAVMHQNHI